MRTVLTQGRRDHERLVTEGHLTTRALILKPHALADPGLVGRALRARGVEIAEHVLADDGPPPALDGYDVLVVMGAPWSVDGDEVRPWIEGLLQRLRDAVEADVPVLGICFGAQAFAQANGGWVARAGNTEVGLHEVETDEPDRVPPGPWFMWHGDTFGPPEEATVIARTGPGPQAYTVGPHVLVQFHPEATADIVARWLAFDDADFHRQGVDPDETLAAMRRAEPEAKVRAETLVSRFLDGGKRQGAGATNRTR